MKQYIYWIYFFCKIIFFSILKMFFFFFCLIFFFFFFFNLKKNNSIFFFFFPSFAIPPPLHQQAQFCTAYFAQHIFAQHISFEICTLIENFFLISFAFNFFLIKTIVDQLYQEPVTGWKTKSMHFLFLNFLFIIWIYPAKLI